MVKIPNLVDRNVSPTRFAFNEYAWEITIVLVGLAAACSPLYLPDATNDLPRRVILSFAMLVATQSVLLAIHYQKHRKLLQEKLDGVDEKLTIQQTSINSWVSAHGAIRVASDPLFSSLANDALEKEASLIADFEVHYVVAEHPRFLRKSLEAAGNCKVFTIFYIESMDHVDLWLTEMMQCYINDTARIAKKNKISIHRVLAVSPGVCTTPEEWDRFKSVMQFFADNRMSTYVNSIERLSKVFPERQDLVLVGNSRLHIHAKKGTLHTTYSKAVLSVNKERLSRLEDAFSVLIGESLVFPAKVNEIAKVACRI